MLRSILAVTLVAVLACADQAERTQSPLDPAPSGPAALEGPVRHLQIAGTTFQTPRGTPFQWRGISSFRLIEMVAHGRRAEAAAFLDWVAARTLTVVRVFSTAKHLFELTPEDGERALPELLEMAAARGLYLEVVALTDTGDRPMDEDAHVRAIGKIAVEHWNAIVEIANEPAHPTQARRLHDARELKRLAALVPDAVPVAWGSAEEDPAFAGGDYATMHFPRGSGPGGWGHVLALARGASLIADWRKPVVSDEPIGAGQEVVAGRRDNDPGRFRAAALLTRLSGLGATFHYEGGLQSRIPSGRELECFDAWNESWTLLPGDVEPDSVLRSAGEPGAAVRGFSPKAARAVFERQRANTAWAIALDVRSDPALRWATAWKQADVRRLDRVWLVTARRPPR
jgi:hypothetical protein